MSEPQIQQRPAQTYLGIAGSITDGVPAFVDHVFPELFGWLREQAVEPAGAPFIRGRHTGERRARAGRLSARGPLSDAHACRPVPEPERSRPRHRAGATLPCCLERYLVGPVDEADFMKWETEFAYLILDD